MVLVENGISATPDLYLSAYICASKRLLFLDALPSGRGREILFHFRDPDGELSIIDSDFKGGAPTAAIDMGIWIRRLRRAMDGR